MTEGRPAPPKPLPQAEPLAKPYWDSLKDGAMQLQRCGACEKFVFYPRVLCPSCGSRQLTWQRVSGRGRLHSFCIPHRHPSPAFQPSLPYVVALVELDEGVRLMTNLVDAGTDPAQLMALVDKPVEVVYEKVNDDVTLPKFKPT
jgi:uncharacterized OB-fold protein